MNQEELEAFVEADMKNVVDLFQVFNKGTHGSAGTFTRSQLQAIPQADRRRHHVPLPLDQLEPSRSTRDRARPHRRSIAYRRPKPYRTSASSTRSRDGRLTAA